jgi:transketolase
VALRKEHITLRPVTKPGLDASRAEVIAFLSETARQIRLQDLALVHFGGAGHIGGDFSATDILTTLYGVVLDVAPDRGRPREERGADRLGPSARTC